MKPERHAPNGQSLIAEGDPGVKIDPLNAIINFSSPRHPPLGLRGIRHVSPASDSGISKCLNFDRDPEAVVAHLSPRQSEMPGNPAFLTIQKFMHGNAHTSCIVKTVVLKWKKTWGPRLWHLMK
ncbi:MAG TPA: hypothetical protein VGC14_20565 [Rhizobium sp.]